MVALEDIAEDNEQCRQLWFAVLEQALDDLTHKTQRFRDAAMAWIRGRTLPIKDYFNSCRSLCQMLSIDYDALLQHSIKVYKQKTVKSPRKKKSDAAMEYLESLDTAEMTITEITRATGTPCYGTVRDRLRRLGKAYLNRPANTPTEHIDAVFRDNDVSNLTISEISEKFGLVKSTVQSRLLKHKIPHKADSMRRPPRAGQTKEWWK